MLAFDALIQRRVFCAGEHGLPTRIPRGRCTVEAHGGFVSVTWCEDGGERTAVMSGLDFEAYLEAGAIVIVGTVQPASVGKAASRSTTE